jgi:hypothetical protein
VDAETYVQTIPIADRGKHADHPGLICGNFLMSAGCGLRNLVINLRFAGSMPNGKDVSVTEQSCETSTGRRMSLQNRYLSGSVGTRHSNEANVYYISLHYKDDYSDKVPLVCSIGVLHRSSGYFVVTKFNLRDLSNVQNPFHLIGVQNNCASADNAVFEGATCEDLPPVRVISETAH